MRLNDSSPLLLALALGLGACGTPAATGVTTPTTDAAADVEGADAPSPLDAVTSPDVPAALDVVEADQPPGPDAQVAADVPAADVPAADVPASCPELSTLCAGLCVDTRSDPRHCGACGNACGAGMVCAMGACGVTCPAMTTNCEGLCRDLQRDAAHCGACGNQCAAGQSCVAGACQTVCPAGQTACEGTCRATMTDPDACGGCSMACPTPTNATRYCAAGACGSACVAGFGDCDGDAANGCEASLGTILHCGGCGRSCNVANASASCEAGACRIGVCSMGYADCNMSPTDGCEINTLTAPSHCGACGRACGSGQLCLGGACVEQCPSGQTSCGGGCTSTSFDPNHCGGCGRACPLVPNTLRACASGVCVPGVCAPGFADCNRNAVDGCEVAVGTDINNCGACGAVCNVSNGTAVCRDGMCGFGACNAGFASCDGNDANGCETNLQTTTAHCGACGNACGAGQICRDSMCVMAGGFSTDWTLQMGTRGQYTRCQSVTASGSQVTCVNPEIRYGTVTGGIPYTHSGNNYNAWCMQLGYRSYVRSTTATRSVAAPLGRLFGCTSYDETVWHWCDWSDGTWYNQRLDYHTSASDGIASVTCTL